MRNTYDLLNISLNSGPRFPFAQLSAGADLSLTNVTVRLTGVKSVSRINRYPVLVLL